MATNTSTCKLDKNFDVGENKTLKSGFSSPDEWGKSLSDIKVYVEEHFDAKKRAKERKIQQQLIRQVNGNTDSEYYLVDMEYTPQFVKCGTFDLIAVTKHKGQNGKFSLPIIDSKHNIDIDNIQTLVLCADFESGDDTIRGIIKDALLEKDTSQIA